MLCAGAEPLFLLIAVPFVTDDSKLSKRTRCHTYIALCHLSLGFQKARNCMDWEIGVHGLIINFRDPQSGHSRSATFLPEVPAQEGWTKQQTIDSLVRKSGYSGVMNQALYDMIELTTYRSSPFSMSYHEYASVSQAVG